MPLVTDKQYYMDENLKSVLDLCVKRQGQKWDNVLICDGEERSGKSTLIKSSAYYVADKINKPFSINNVFFDPEEMLDFAVNNTEEVIIWDEAALGALSVNWHNKIQKKLNTMLMMTGKYRHTYFFIIPNFFRLNKYLALDRSHTLMHVYSPDMVKRGLFTCYNRKQKTWVYNNNRKSEMYSKDYSFRGRFTLKNTENIIDEEAYERKKDEAIKKFLHDSGQDQELLHLRYKLASLLPVKQAMLVGGISRQTVYNWRKLGDKL